MKIGNLGELASQLEFAKMGYEVYTPAIDNTTFDFLVHKDGVIGRVEVKTTSTRSKTNSGWSVQLKSVRPNRTENIIKTFDNTKVDYLCVYIQPLDKVIILLAREIDNKTSLVIKD